VADRLINFLSGDGKEMAQVMFVPHERQVLQSYADLLRKMQIPQVGANWSNNYKIVEMLGKVAKVVGGAVGAVIGHAAGGGYLGTAAGAVAGERIAGIGQKFGDISRARQISRQMPLVTDAMRKWAKAVHQAQKNNSPPSNGRCVLCWRQPHGQAPVICPSPLPPRVSPLARQGS
jgi:hypothetical protein